MTSTTTSSRTRRFALRTAAVAAVIVGIVLGTAVVAQAYAPDVSMAGGWTSTGTVNATTYTGRVYDTSSDGLCMRVYGKGYNYVRGWGSGNYRAQACGNGTSTAWNESPAVYSDNYAVSLCRGMPDASRSNCTPYYKVR